VLRAYRQWDGNASTDEVANAVKNFALRIKAGSVVSMAAPLGRRMK
jgi:hypothetical protein